MHIQRTFHTTLYHLNVPKNLSFLTEIGYLVAVLIIFEFSIPKNGINLINVFYKKDEISDDLNQSHSILEFLV